MTDTNKKQIKPSGIALIPFLFFIALILGVGLYFTSQGVEGAFNQLKASVAVFAAIVLAFFIYKGSVDEKVNSFIRGASDENITIMVMTCFLAGAFAGVASASGGVDSVVNLGLSIIPPKFITAGLFVIAMFMSLATGSSSGTTAALGTIAYTIANQAGLNVPMVLAAVLGGAFFGDNLSIISDTTIVATRTQGIEMRDKFRMNLTIALPGAIIATILYLILGTPEVAVDINPGEFNFLLVLPYIYVLAASLFGMNVFLVLGSGAIFSGIMGMVASGMTFIEFAQAIHAGFADMTEIVLLAIFIGGLSQMMQDQGGIEWIMQKIGRISKDERSAQVGISVLVAGIDMAVANNTAALIVSADVCREISDEYKVDPRRTASLMDIFCCVAQGFIPYGNQILLITALAMGTVAPVQIIPFMWYNMLLGVFAILSIYVPFADGLIKKDPWNWTYRASESTVERLKSEGIELEEYNYSK